MPDPEGFLELPPVVLVRIEVGCDNNAVAELASGQALLRLLAVDDRVELDKGLRRDKRRSQSFAMPKKHD